MVDDLREVLAVITTNDPAPVLRVTDGDLAA